MVYKYVSSILTISKTVNMLGKLYIVVNLNRESPSKIYSGGPELGASGS